MTHTRFIRSNLLACIKPHAAFTGLSLFFLCSDQEDSGLASSWILTSRHGQRRRRLVVESKSVSRAVEERKGAGLTAVSLQAL